MDPVELIVELIVVAAPWFAASPFQNGMSVTGNFPNFSYAVRSPMRAWYNACCLHTNCLTQHALVSTS